MKGRFSSGGDCIRNSYPCNYSKGTLYGGVGGWGDGVGRDVFHWLSVYSLAPIAVRDQENKYHVFNMKVRA